MKSTLSSHPASMLAGEQDTEFLRDVIDALFAFVGVLSTDGVLLEVNTASLNAAGVPSDQIGGRHLWEYYWWNYSHEMQQQVQAACEQAAQGQTVRFDAVARMPNERRLAIDLQVAPLRNRMGEVSYLIASAVDISRRKDAEEALVERERRKDAFIAALAHELRNPLGPIRNSLEILAKLGSPDERAVRARDVIGRQVTHLVGLVDDLLDIARIGRGSLPLNLRLCDLGAIAAQTAEDYRASLEAAGCTLEIRRPSTPVMVRADPVRLGQVVRNFLQNAQRFAAGAPVTLECSADRERQLAVVKVSDAGQGFTPQTAAKLFETFGQAEQGPGKTHGGLGLGLSLTKSLVQLQGGSVSAHSAGLGQGATFEFCLPLVTELRQDDVRGGTGLPPLAEHA